MSIILGGIWFLSGILGYQMLDNSPQIMTHLQKTVRVQQQTIHDLTHELHPKVVKINGITVKNLGEMT